MSPLDGNAIGGLLLEVFSTEMTAAVVTCATCGTAGPVAETIVYLDAPGTVIRCRSCTAVLMMIMRRGGLNCVGMAGLAALDA
jgi:ribosomal protein S27E